MGSLGLPEISIFWNLGPLGSTYAIWAHFWNSLVSLLELPGLTLGGPELTFGAPGLTFGVPGLTFGVPGASWARFWSYWGSLAELREAQMELQNVNKPENSTNNGSTSLGFA